MNKKTIIGLITGGTLLSSGLAGLFFSDKITALNLKKTKLNKNYNLVIGVFGFITIVGALISALIIDKEFYPEDEIEEDEDVFGDN